MMQIALLLLLVLAGDPVKADWKIEGKGDPPTITVVPGPNPIVVPPPPSPPPPLPPPVDEDHSPFVWPPQPNLFYRDEQRYAAVGQGFYVGEQQYMNPIPGSGLYAGNVQDPLARAGSWFIGGYRVWAPKDADPATIRRVVRTGRP